MKISKILYYYCSNIAWHVATFDAIFPETEKVSSNK